MGIFSRLSLSNFRENKNSATKGINFDNYFDRDFFAEIVDSSSSMMVYFFKGEGWIGASKSFLETFDFADIAEFNEKNESIRDMFLSESEEIFTESDKSWLDYIKKYKTNGYSLRILGKDKSVLSIKAKCHSYSKNTNFYILELEDVSKLHEAKVNTEAVEKLKTKFLANIGHEFRTPMNAILGFVELMQQTNLDKQQLEYINMISHSSKNLMTNIETLLDLSQLQSGRLEVDSLPLNILPNMERLAFVFCKEGSQKGVKVLTFIDPKLPQEVYSDAKKINQVMFSLIDNAVKYTPKGGKVIIEVKLLKRQKNGDCSIGFGVKDNGSGISAEQMASINEPFTSSNAGNERLGIGLNLSQGLIKLLGSELKIQSNGGEGTYVNFVLNFKASVGQNFKMMPKTKVKVLLLDQKRVDEANFLTIYLRAFAIDVVKSNQLDENVYSGVEALYIVADKDDASWRSQLGTYVKKTPITLLLDNGGKLPTQLTHLIDETIARPLLASNVAKHLYTINSLVMKEEKAKLKIRPHCEALVVEDNLINQRLIQILLQSYNILVSTAINGVEAVDMCAKFKYDIVFMDIDMPEKDGISATKEIKEAVTPNGDTPIVALTAMAMDGDRDMLIAKGLDDYMAKPLTREKLESILQKYLNIEQE
ncbi:response regulator [Sulfurimonas aquatica]|uniref:histidine kinase n=1 Tax=Sulfurimonas aquatica TaxID=2672570 RepID=A0A975B1I3_9BACT|nr:response regulator [Sulfurimonas aquatica]QSZ42479.1 response regulator [Sulfurimonas aquatica]